MVCLFFFGYKHMGACDYFRYNSGEFYVTARMYHMQFLPMGADQAVLRIPGMSESSIIVTQVPGVLGRCYRWAALRSYSFLVSMVLAFLGIFSFAKSNPNAGAAALVFSIVSLVVFIWAYFKKPKCSPERARGYMGLIRPRQEWPPENQSGSFKEHLHDSFDRVADLVRPPMRFEALSVSETSEEHDADDIEMQVNQGEDSRSFIDIKR